MVQTKTLFASAARTATPTAVEFGVDLLRDVELIEVCIVTSAAGTTPSTVPTIEVYNELSASWQTVVTGAAITATGNVILRYGEEVAIVTNLAAQGIVAPRMRLSMTHGNATSHTYSVLLRVA